MLSVYVVFLFLSLLLFMNVYEGSFFVIFCWEVPCSPASVCSKAGFFNEWLFFFWTVAIRPCTSSEIEHHGLYILLAGAAMMKQSEMNVGLTHIHFV